MPNPPPASASSTRPGSAAPSFDLRAIQLPPLPPADSALVLYSHATGPIPPAELPKLRASLLLSRAAAVERAQTCGSNRAALAERLAAERSSAAREASKSKEAERKRRRDDDARKAAEAAEKVAAASSGARPGGAAAAKGAPSKAVKKEQSVELSAPSSASKGKPRAAEELAISGDLDSGSRTGSDAHDEDTPMGDVSASTSTAGTPAPIPVKVPAPNHLRATPSVDTDDDMRPPHLPRHHDKKKRKRDLVVDSDASGTEDDQPALQRVRAQDSMVDSTSPSPLIARTPLKPVAPTPSVTDARAAVEQKLKEERFSKHSIPIKPPAPGTASAFFVPSNPLVPPKPPANPPQPTAKRQSDVTGDFSNAKPGQQIAHSTFQNWVDAYLRPFGEDDLAVLAAKPEDLTPYIIPPLGKHYLERWEEEDLDPSQRPSTSSSFNSSLEPPVLPRLRPDALAEDALAGENVFLGPLSERLMAALAVGEDGLVNVEDDDDDSHSIEDGSYPPKLPMDAVDFEERVKRELRYIGILPEDEVDWASREDDEVSSALRACQRLLHQQTAMNEARKAILMSLVKDRMAYQDYETARDAQERVIEQGWQKRLRTDVKKKKKGKERDRRPGGGGSGSAAAAADAGNHEDPSKAPVSAELLDAVARRDRLVSTFKPFFDEEEPGHFYGLPERSIFEGLEAEVLGDDLEAEDGEPTAESTLVVNGVAATPAGS
ncbi:hypothetical protein JCM8115_004457 [Rhodotorula mucilaginosa]|uniref:Transcriptional regulator Ngg1 n=1 Tax=Rhodotorula mucilaginosa TaxID=5537 RepID=A0A9P6W707_RHOMI|nr:hypothetical protein C6P46_005963 [Rhodotorula mucilaginosa]